MWKKKFSVATNKKIISLQMPMLYLGVCYKHAEVTTKEICCLTIKS